MILLRPHPALGCVCCEIEVLDGCGSDSGTPEAGAEGAGGQIQRADIGHLGRLGLEGGGTLVLPPPGQASEALFAQQHRQGVDADGLVGGGQLPLDVVDGKVAFTQRHGAVADAIADGGVLRAVLGLLEEGGAFGGIVTKLVAEDPKGPRGVGEVPGDLDRGARLDEVGAEGLVLAVERVFGGDEKARFG